MIQSDTSSRYEIQTQSVKLLESHQEDLGPIRRFITARGIVYIEPKKSVINRGAKRDITRAPSSNFETIHPFPHFEEFRSDDINFAKGDIFMVSISRELPNIQLEANLSPRAGHGYSCPFQRPLLEDVEEINTHPGDIAE